MRVESVWKARSEDVEHQADVLGVVHRPLAEPAGVVLVGVDAAAEGLDVLAGLRVVAVAGAAVAGLEGDPLLDGADRVEVLVELAAVVAGRSGRGGRPVSSATRSRTLRSSSPGRGRPASERKRRSKASLGLISRATGVVGLDQEMCEP